MNRRRTPALLALLATALLLPVPDAWAAPFVATKTADTADGTCDADCSLREAVVAANASGGSDTILVPPGTYSFAIDPDGTPDDAQDGDLDVTESVTIQRQGATGTVVVDAQDKDRIFHVFDPASLTLADLTVRNGTATDGGGIFHVSSGTLTLTGVTVADNQTGGDGGGIRAAGPVVITGSTVTGNTSTNVAGGMYLFGGVTATITDSTIGPANAALWGGGIWSAATLTIRGSTVVGNTDVNGGGGIVNREAAMTLVNSTVTGNSSLEEGGGIYQDPVGSPTLALSNVTVTGNTADADGAGGAGDGGGLYLAGGTATIRNSIVAGNTDASAVTKHPDCSGAISSAGYNLVQDPTGCTGLAGSDLVGPSPGLTALGPNGGPTQTHALLATSPAIDAGDPAGCTDGVTALATDQRGEPRPAGLGCDIGAYEFEPLAKELDLRAKPRRIDRGERSRLIATVTPCDGHQGDLVRFLRKDKVLAEKATNDACRARLKVRPKRTTTYRAEAPQQDPDHGAATDEAKVKVRRP